MNLSKKIIVSLCFVTVILISLAFFWTDNRDKLIVIPILFDDSNIPIVKTEVNHQNCYLKFDTGSRSQLALRSFFLEKIDKQLCDKKNILDLNGNEYPSSIYQVSSLRIGDLKLKNIRALEEGDLQAQNKTVWENKENTSQIQSVGHIGRPILENWNFLFDFPNKKIIALHNKKLLLKHGYNIEKWLKISFVPHKYGIILNTTTDLGSLRLILDTGTSFVLINSKKAVPMKIQKDFRNLSFAQTSQFLIAGHDFHNVRLYLFDIDPSYEEFDGILGMYFLKHHQFYIDYQDHCLYLNPTFHENDFGGT